MKIQDVITENQPSVAESADLPPRVIDRTGYAGSYEIVPEMT